MLDAIAADDDPRGLHTDENHTMTFSLRFASLAFALSLGFGLLNCGNGICADDSCQCDKGVCEFDCPQGGCEQQCEGDSECTFTCEGGGCQQQCNDEAVCTMSCEGGDCQQLCSTSGDCSSTCTPNNCLSL